MKRNIPIVLLSLFVLIFHVSALAENKSALEPQVISLPKGPGSVNGLGESFEPQLNTGTAAFSVKLEVSPGINKHQPEVILSYNSGYGNSSAGLGWEMNSFYIQRQTDKGLPQYLDTDTFIYSSDGELVNIGNNQFRLKIEGRFIRFVKKDGYWEAWEKDGTYLVFGQTASARMSNDKGVFRWYLEKAVDTNDNEIRYAYLQDQGQVYLDTIAYSIVDHQPMNLIQFDYETRHDPFESYLSRAKVLTSKRLKTVEMLNQGQRVRKYVLEYSSDSIFSLLIRIVQYGKDDAAFLPPLTFGYSAFDFSTFDVVNMSSPPDANITNNNTDLVDINGDSLPDVVYTPHEQDDKRHKFYLNAGNGSWQENSTISERSPFCFLDNTGTQMADMDGDGLADLLVKQNDDFGFYRSRGNASWQDDDWQPCSPNPFFGFEDPLVRMVDLNHDPMTDILQTTSRYSYTYWLNGKNCLWVSDVAADGIGYQFSNFGLKLGDINGDGLEDLVYISPYTISYFPSKGYAEFDSETELSGAIIPDFYLQGERFFINDMNNDGFADLVYVADQEILIWLNTGQNSFMPFIRLSGTPAFNATATAIRIADMDGDGLKEILYNDAMAAVHEKYRYVRFNSGVHPNLLTRIDNGLGMVTEITYKSSTEYYIQAMLSEPWETRIPFPVHVVSRKAVTDKNSSQSKDYVTDYIYRDGYYDGEEREFRGFAKVDTIEYGDPTAPALKIHHLYDVGKTEKSRKGMIVEQADLTQTGTIEPVSGLYQHIKNTIETRQLAAGVNKESVRFSFTSSQNTLIYENTQNSRQLRTDFDYDDYGNEVKKFIYGEIADQNFAKGNDEILTSTAYMYRIDDTHWMVDRPVRITQTGISGNFVSDTKNTFDDRGNLIMQEKTPDNSAWIPVIRNDYDTYGNIIKITNANINCRTIGYDSILHTFPVSETICVLNLSMSADYDYRLGKIISFTDFNSQVTQFGYDTFGRLIQIVKPGDSETYPTQSFEYHLSDPISHIITKSRETAGQAGTYDAYIYYDGLGRKLQVRSEGVNGQWVVSETVSFNLRGKEKQKWLPYFANTSAYQPPDQTQAYMTIVYDPTQRIIREVNPDNTFRTTEYLPLEKRVADEEDNAAGSSHTNTPHLFTYDGLERLVKVTEQNGSKYYTTAYSYDGLNNLIKIVDDHGNIKTITFDGLSRKTYMNDPDKGEMRYSYDSAGNLIKTVDNKAQEVSYAYDEANRILTETYNNTQIVYHYDHQTPADRTDLTNTAGRLTYVEDETGRTAFSYNARGNVILKAKKIAGQEYILGMNYDSMNRMTRLIYPDGMTAEFRYNAMNQLESIPGYVNAIDYHPSGQKTRFVYSNGAESVYDYDTRHRMKTLKTSVGSKTIQDLSYTYDTISNITAITDGRTQPTPESHTRQFGYDDLYRLTKCTAPSWNIQYGYDSIGNLISQNSDIADSKVNLGELKYGEGTAGPHAVTKAGAFAYTYDSNGNIQMKTGYNFSFDPKDRMTAMNHSSDGLQAAYRYDYTGNRVIRTVTSNEKTETTIYIDQAAEVRGSQLIEYVFAGNRRVASIHKPFSPESLLTQPTVYEFDDFDANKDGAISLSEIKAKGSDPQKAELGEVRDALKIFHQSVVQNPAALPFGVMAAAVQSSGIKPVEGKIQTRFYIPDHLGSASIIADEFGNVVEESVYYPYGMERTRTGDFRADYRFTGKELDGESELHYFGARYYDGMVGRFVSVDPLYVEINSLNENKIRRFLANSKEINIYAYVQNNPVIFTDPSGLIIKYENDEIKQYSDKLKEISATGKQIIENLDKSDETFTVKFASGGSGYKSDTKTIYFNPKKRFNNDDWGKDIEKHPELALIHEFIHAEHQMMGTLNANLIKPKNGIMKYLIYLLENKITEFRGGINLDEEYKTIGIDEYSKEAHTENKVREDYKINARTKYDSGPCGKWADFFVSRP